MPAALTALLGLALLPLAALGQSGAPARYLEGEHYIRLAEPLPSQAGDDQVGVTEFFLYSCSHCYEFDAELQAWLKKQPQAVAFRRVPVTFGPGPIYARLFYTAKALGVLDQLHDDIFDSIHQRQQPLTNVAAMRAFFVAHGVDAAAFDRAFNSKKVAAAVARATALMKAYGVVAVPSMGVAGKYWVSPRMAGSYQRMLNIVDYLVAWERSTAD